MSCDYANGLTPYTNKGVLGIPEVFDDEETVNEKCARLAEMIAGAKHVVVHTGAGISTSVGIPDFRGPNGVWTLEKKGEKPNVNISFSDAIPSKTHMALKALTDSGHVKYIVSQNIDGLHLKSGLAREFLAELHGNMFVENCNKCRRQFVRSTPAPTVGQKKTGGICKGGKTARACRGGYLLDNILDWEHDLPENDLDMSFYHATLADLNICLGTTLQINPSGTLPLKNQKYGGRVVICNLQPTKYDKKADLVISTYVDDVLEKVLKRMGIELPEYNVENDPTKQKFCELEWTIPSEMIKAMEKVYNDKVKAARKRKSAAAEEADEKVDKKKVKSETKDNDIKANCHEIKIENGIQIEDGIKVVPDERGTNAGCETEDTNGCAPQSDSIVGSEEVTVANGDGGKSKEAQNGASVGSSGDGESKTNEEMSKNGDNDVVTGER